MDGKDAAIGVTAAIVHYSGGDSLDRCVSAALVADNVDDVIIVDNQGVAAALRQRYSDRVRVIAMDRNVGYGRAANIALARASAGAVLLLNQDTVIAPDAVTKMVKAGVEANASVVGPRLVGPAGSVAPLKTQFPPPLRWSPPGRAPTGLVYVPWIAGAAMLFMPGGRGLRFDARLFFYAEDEELCWRIWSSGGRVIVAEEAEVMHTGGTAAATIWTPRATTWRTIVNRARFIRWHGGWMAVPAFLAGTARSWARRRLHR